MSRRAPWYGHVLAAVALWSWFLLGMLRVGDSVRIHGELYPGQKPVSTTAYTSTIAVAVLSSFAFLLVCFRRRDSGMETISTLNRTKPVFWWIIVSIVAVMLGLRL